MDAFLRDLNAHTLVLGKDCAPASVFRRLVKAQHPAPYRHDLKLPTNKMLRDVLAHVGIDAPLDGSKAATCGVYYANAYWLLRDDDEFSGGLPNAVEGWGRAKGCSNTSFPRCQGWNGSSPWVATPTSP